MNEETPHETNGRREFEKCNDAKRHVLHRRHRRLNFEFRAIHTVKFGYRGRSERVFLSEKSWLLVVISLVAVEHGGWHIVACLAPRLYKWI